MAEPAGQAKHFSIEKKVKSFRLLGSKKKYAFQGTNIYFSISNDLPNDLAY